MNNPYGAPAADMSQPPAQAPTYDPVVWSTTGRIGRVRYLAYTFTISFGIVFVFSFFTKQMKLDAEQLRFVLLAAYVPVLGVMAIMGVRRLHDMNRPSTLALLNLIPVVNLLFSLWLVLVRGDEGTNSYGLAPKENGIGVVIGACLITPLFLLGLAGVVAAVAIPLHKDYLINKSEQAIKRTSPGSSAQP